MQPSTVLAKVQTDPNTPIHSKIVSHHVRPLASMPADGLSGPIWHLPYDLCPRLPPFLDLDFAALSSRHSISADSVVIVIVIVAAIGNEEVGGAVLPVSLLGRPTLNVSVAALVPTIEEIMTVSRSMSVGSVAAALKNYQGPLRL
jgi:hypothetical protein